jgi:integrase
MTFTLDLIIDSPEYRRKQKMPNGTIRELPTIWIKYYQNGRAVRESTGTTKETVARRMLRTREGDVEHGIPITPKVGGVTFEEAAQDLLNDYQANGKKTRGDTERRIEKHLRPHFGGWRLASISTTDVRAFVANRQQDTITVGEGEQQRARPYSNAEINRELTVLKRMFTLAVQAGKLFVKPHIPMLKEDNVRNGFFEAEQFASVRAHLKPHLQNVAAVAYITGWRVPSEILPLEWRQIDFNAGEVRLDPGTTKNGDGRVFPMTIELRHVLEDQQATANRLKREKGLIPRYVFTKPNGARVGSFRKAWASACKAAGCPGRVLHDFRRTAVRNLVRAGVPERVAMQMTGHKTRSVFERYNIVSPGDLREAARRLDAVGHNLGHTQAK